MNAIEINAILDKANVDLAKINSTKGFSPEAAPVLSAEVGKKYIRIVRESYGSRSAYCFIEMATGRILKPASWKAPTTNFSRGMAKDLTDSKFLSDNFYGF